MFFVTLLTAFVALTSSGPVSAADTIKFVNHCPYDLYSWTVGPTASGYTDNDHAAVTIAANAVTVHEMVNGEAIGGGIALKLRDLPNYQVAPAGIIQVEYNLKPSKKSLWYNLSAVDCKHDVGPENPSFCPLIGGGMQIHVEHAAYGKCPPAWCSAEGCHNIYDKPGHWQGEPTFQCDAGADIIVELCTEKAGPRTFNGHTEPLHSVEPQSDPRRGDRSTDGVCGIRSPNGATCFGFAHGNCCSEYGWCGYSEAHCGMGCQSDFGDCFGKPASQYSPYQPPAKPSTIKSSYSGHTPTHVKPTPSYHSPESRYSQPTTTYQSRYSHVEHTKTGYSKYTSSYTAPIHSKYTPVHSKSTYSIPAGYTPPVHNPEYSPPYSPSHYHTIYATHTVTETPKQVTKTVTVDVNSAYIAPSMSLEYHAPPPAESVNYPPPSSVCSAPKHTHVYTQPQEPNIPSTWYNKPYPTVSYDVPTTSLVYSEPMPSKTMYVTEPVYYPPEEREVAYYPPEQHE